VDAPLAVVEAAWYDAARWREWVHGLEEVVEVDPGWPREDGAGVVWSSNPAGRGTVHERVVGYDAGSGQRLSVLDDLIEAEQEIAFASQDGDSVQVSLTLNFRRRRGGLFTALVDQFFSRRAMTDALANTLERFAGAVAADARR
jgi:uncharacterized membrane protein